LASRPGNGNFTLGRANVHPKLWRRARNPGVRPVQGRRKPAGMLRFGCDQGGEIQLMRDSGTGYTPGDHTCSCFWV